MIRANTLSRRRKDQSSPTCYWQTKSIALRQKFNRAPAKVQSALLEAMQEKQVTLGKETYDLPSPFLVLATKNPIEQEGTYSLPDAQVDRFMFKLKVGYPMGREKVSRS